MQAGMLNSENLAQILRSAAQRRQNGSLEITQPDHKFQIIFLNGKIADAYKESEDPVTRAARRAELAGDSGTTLLLRTVVKHDVLNMLFELDVSRDSIFAFNNYMPDIDRDYAASISVGQFLLDKASLDVESKRFAQLFKDDPFVIKFELAGLELAEEEQIFYESLPDRARVSEILNTTFLSRYHATVFLLSFHERAIIELDNEAATAEAPLGEDILDILEESSARPFVEKELLPQEKAKKDLKPEPEQPQAEVKKEEKPAKKVEVKAKVSKSKSNSKLKLGSVLSESLTLLMAVSYIAAFAIIVALKWGEFLRAF